MFEVQEFNSRTQTWKTIHVAGRVDAGKYLAKLRAKNKMVQYRMRVQPLQDREVAA